MASPSTRSPPSAPITYPNAPPSPPDLRQWPVDDIDPESLDLRQLKGIREVDAGSIIGPVISHSQSDALYAAARSSTHSPPPSVSASDEEGDDKIVAHPTKTEQEILKREKEKAPAPQTKKAHQRGAISFSLPSIQLPSLPNVSLPSFSASHSNLVSLVDNVRNRRRAKTMVEPASTKPACSSPKPPSFTPGKPAQYEARTALHRDLSRAGSLRRSTSTGSLPRRLSRVGSTTSSVGDDSQFRHIQSRSNPRLQAIKDNLRAGLPTMPQLQQQLANLNPFSDRPEGSAALLVPRDPPELEALDKITGDVVVLGGYRGSILRDKTANNRRVWIPFTVGLGLRKIDLEVGLEPEDEEAVADRIVADGMLTHIGPVDISRRLLKRLRTGELGRGRRIHEWGYDWRLSPALLTKRLITFLESLPCNKLSPDNKRTGALVIAHSLGGLIVRAAINQRPDLFSGVLYAGTPQHCINILGPLRDGDSVLFNSKVFTAQVNLSLRSSFVFLPESGRCFIDRTTGDPIPLDFFNINTWREYGLSPCVSDLPISTASTKSAILQTLKPQSSEVATALAPQMSSSAVPPNPFTDPSLITIPKPTAISYLERTLSETLAFKRSLAFNPALRSQYPPTAVLYSKTTPTVRGAKVAGKQGIKKADVYDELVFGAGDGVCLARAAQLPEGYTAIRKVAVDRGHLGLLGDLESVGRCVQGILEARGW